MYWNFYLNSALQGSGVEGILKKEAKFCAWVMAVCMLPNLYPWMCVLPHRGMGCHRDLFFRSWGAVLEILNFVASHNNYYVLLNFVRVVYLHGLICSHGSHLKRQGSSLYNYLAHKKQKTGWFGHQYNGKENISATLASYIHHQSYTPCWQYV